MGSFRDRISLDGFSIGNIDTSEIDSVALWLPANGIVDVNIAEKGLVMTLHAQNICQELIVKVDRWISVKEGEKNKAWTNAALTLAPAAGYKTIKDKEWFSQADDTYIEACNEVAIAKAAKKWLENKAGYFSGWHYAFKTFVKRDYSLEKLGNFQPGGYNDTIETAGRKPKSVPDGTDLCGEIEWQE